MRSSPWRCVFRSAFITGAIGLCAGFFGLVVFTPNSNQGPLLGIVVTGLLSFVGGALGGGIYCFMDGRSR
jgi:hypothetical protein